MKLEVAGTVPGPMNGTSNIERSTSNVECGCCFALFD